MSTTEQMPVWLALVNGQEPFIRPLETPNLRVPVEVTDVLGFGADGGMYVSVTFLDPVTGVWDVAAVNASGVFYAA